MATEVTVTDPERKAEFEQVFGTATVPVRGWLPHMASLPIGWHRVYELDLDRITPEQRERLVAHLAAKFGGTIDESRARLEAEGVPILAESCSVTHDRPDFL